MKTSYGAPSEENKCHVLLLFEHHHKRFHSAQEREYMDVSENCQTITNQDFFVSHTAQFQ